MIKHNYLMRALFTFSWLALLFIPLGIYLESSGVIWGAVAIATVLMIIMGLMPCRNCSERVHLHVYKGLLGKVKIGFPFGRCDHCGESYL